MFKPRTKFRVIVNGVSFYSTAEKIRAGVGDQTDQNRAVGYCLFALENSNYGPQKYRGLAGTWDGFNVQIDLA